MFISFLMFVECCKRVENCKRAHKNLSFSSSSSSSSSYYYYYYYYYYYQKLTTFKINLKLEGDRMKTIASCYKLPN